jgi:dienelactone hydrolase
MFRSASALLLALTFAVVSSCRTKPSATVSNTPSNTASSNTVTAVPSSGGEQKVTIDSPDGLKLVGTLYPAEKPNSPAVLLLHQWQSDRHSYDAFATRLQAKGFAVLSVDGRGFGESTKMADGKNVAPERTDAAVRTMLSDVGAAFDYLRKQKNVDPERVGIVGASYGSSLAIIYAAYRSNVKAVVLLSPGLNYFGNMQTEPAVKKYADRGPLLLVAAADDAESASAVKTLKGDDPKAEDKVYDQNGHGTGLFTAGVGLEDLLENFLIRSLSH